MNLYAHLYEHQSSLKVNVTVTHRNLLNHYFNWNNFSVLNEESHLKKRLVSEMIHISLQKNSISEKDDTRKLTYCYIYFLNERKYS